MVSREKFAAKLKRKPVPKDVKFSELQNYLIAVGYQLSNKGKSSGSRVKFIDKDMNIIMLHKSHGADPVKPKALAYVVEALYEHGVLESER
ncbi:type II toxin-antitoxin system HicA family toxin [Alteromonadaceae bacterium M269]|nr:type II toxin-antitoxin system HicA family toxin [Alteromonadaceae bacterium M269]